MFEVNKFFVFLSAFICACTVGLWLTCGALAGQPTLSVDSLLDATAKALEKSKEEVNRLKDVWDKSRLETTLYDQRAKRAYQRWAALGARAAKKLREQAKAAKERAELELQLA